MGTTKGTHGGRRPGAGRRAADPARPRSKVVAARVSEEERDSIDERLEPGQTRGGWLYRLIRRELGRRRR